MSTQVLGEKAAAYHREGYNCAQAVLLTLYDHMYLNAKNDAIPKIATGFGGGIGRCGSVCGALTGAIMAISLKYGANEINAEKKANAYAKTRALYRQFEKQHGSVMCSELVKLDLSTSQGMAKAKQADVFETVCAKLIKSVIADFFALEKP